MKNKKQLLLRQAKRVLKRHGLHWSVIKPTAKEIVVFGSASVGLKSPKSDLDLLVIGEGKRFKNRDLDIVYKTEQAVRRRRWLGSELAGHIAKYGTWLDGKGEWVRNVRVGSSAVTYKMKLIAARATALERSWETMSPVYRKKHVVKLRRDLQRLELLVKGVAIPPTPILDKRWHQVNNPVSRVKLLLKRAGRFKLLTPKQVDLFLPFWGEVLI